MDTCSICGKPIDTDTCYEYTDERGIKQAVPDLCCNDKCVDEYAERHDCEPTIDYEELAQKQQDDLWEQDVLFKVD